MKLALGLFHFNPHWGADGRMGRRHCAETLGPFLRLLRERPDWQVDIEISGAGLESIQRVYPEQLRLLRLLTERGQVELISSMYTPSLWVAFPRRDLLQSVELNRRCVAKLGLEWTRIFFAQEGFFGMGVSALRDYFDTVVCKDDYLSQQCQLNPLSPCFSLRGMKVLIASNHLLNELASSLKGDPEFSVKHSLTQAHVQHLLQVREISDSRNFPAARCCSGELDWLWYHCGDGNHIGTIHKPDDLERCYYDSRWKALCVSLVESYERSGYKLAKIGDLVASIDYSTAPELPPVIEGSWNPTGADGVFCWMGRNNTPWEDDAGVLTAVTRARARLVAAETMINNLSDSALVNTMRERLQEGWTFLLNAQISDTMGWSASAPAVLYSQRASDQALLTANQLIEEATRDGDGKSDPFDEKQLPQGPGEFDMAICATPELFGAEGHTSLSRINPNVWLLECVFCSSDSYFGVRFPFSMSEIVFCPSGLEEEPTRVPVERLRTDKATLPLSNGLLQIADDAFIIKHTLFVHVAVRIDRKRATAEFAVEGPVRQRSYQWRFFLVRGPLKYAVTVANLVNWV
jgi:hypothetical protein